MAEIYVKIPKKQMQQSNTPTLPNVESNVKNKPSPVGQINNTLIINYLKSGVNTAVSLYEDMTGNTLASRSLNQASELLTIGSMIAFGGPIGIASATLKVASIGYSDYMEKAKINVKSNILTKNVGNDIFNGSRVGR